MALFSAINHIEWHIDFILQGLKRGRGAGDTVIAFNIINIISHIISDREAGIRRSRQTLFCQTTPSLSLSLSPSPPPCSETVSINLISWTSPVTPAGQSHPTISPPNISVCLLADFNAAFCLYILCSLTFGVQHTACAHTVSVLVNLPVHMKLKAGAGAQIWLHWLCREICQHWVHLV